MTTLFLGLIAAVCWGLHDITIRYLSRSVPLLGALLFTLLAGLAFQAIVLAFSNSIRLPQGPAFWLSIGAGVTFLIASLGLYFAFQRGPVRLVSPIIGAYPIASVLFDLLDGAAISVGQILAVLVIVAGVGVVAMLADKSGEKIPPKGPTVALSLLAALGYASTFKLGQMAAALDGGLQSTFLTRITAVALLAGIVLIRKAAIHPGRAAIVPLIIMGLLDGVALLAVFSAGRLDNPHFASISSSMFGLFTILLAWSLLRERMTAPQWAGCAMAFLAIGYLAS